MHANTQYEVTKFNTATNLSRDDTDNYLSNYPNIEIVYEGVEQRTLVEIVPADQHLFIAKKRIRQYIQHYDDQEWEWDEYPEVYFIVDSKAKTKKLNSYIEEKMEDMYLDEDDFAMKAVQIKDTGASF